LVDHIVALEDGGELLPAIDGLMSMCISCHNMKHAGGVRRRGHAARPIASVVCAVMSSKNDNVMLAIEMSYLTSGQQSVYNSFLLD
jgi:HNH endonuclease